MHTRHTAHELCYTSAPVQSFASSSARSDADMTADMKALRTPAFSSSWTPAIVVPAHAKALAGFKVRVNAPNGSRDLAVARGLVAWQS